MEEIDLSWSYGNKIMYISEKNLDIEYMHSRDGRYGFKYRGYGDIIRGMWVTIFNAVHSFFLFLQHVNVYEG